MGLVGVENRPLDDLPTLRVAPPPNQASTCPSLEVGQDDQARARARVVGDRAPNFRRRGAVR
jgi:hypothetical protein